MKIPGRKSYPKELHINEETYTIKWVQEIPEGRKNDDTVGLCDGASHTIYIKRGLTKSQAFRTLIHEVLHALEFEYEIDIPHKTVHQLEKAIGDLLIANF